ncbi:Cytochrome b5 [Orchesella cincta]|uniref:Cytochrome b5 n=1 Tax=Orchesella cincta TaxID=48709 RepID=A0A1D2NFX8_ORCCI|nr:Cytochrome b5 [Orchesella cincta]
MDNESNGIMEKVVQYSAGGTIAALGYQMLSTFVGDLGASTSTLTTPASSDSIDLSDGPSNTMDSIKRSSALAKSWLTWGARSTSSSTSQYSSSGFDKEHSLPLFTLQDVAFHDMHHDCWLILYDRVYDVTSFLSSHPGGDEVMLEYAGHDATLAFRSVGHSKEAEESLKPYLVGILVESERIWTRFSNMKSDIP